MSGHGVIDRELYLPQGWLDDPARLQATGVPDRVGFATKPELTRRMLERALGAGVLAGWVTADEVYAGVRVPGGGRGHRARPASGAAMGGRADLQRDPAPVRRPSGRARG
jgi:hypothetical protein